MISATWSLQYYKKYGFAFNEAYVTSQLDFKLKEEKQRVCDVFVMSH